MMLFWIGAGQSGSNLLNYLTSTLCLAADFTQAMAKDGDAQEIVIYLLASLLILFTISVQRTILLGSKLFLVTLFLFFYSSLSKPDLHAIMGMPLLPALPY